MTETLSNLPSAIQFLDLVISDPKTVPTEVYRALRGLQLLGLNSHEIEIHIERIRAFNEATNQWSHVEHNALDALDVLAGDIPAYRMDWGPAERARILLPRIISKEDLLSASELAYRSNNLLPNQAEDESEDFRGRAAEVVADQLEQLAAKPLPAQFVRAAKSSLTTRPAALMSPPDRMIYAALASLVSTKLTEILPSSVRWPRSPTTTAEGYAAFKAAPLQWEAKYIVATDIESFYECIDHELLTYFARRYLKASSNYADAVECFLEAVMGSKRGLPQGPAASEAFASTYLLPLDLEISAAGWDYVRYADDFLMGASSFSDAKGRLERLESLLQETGLRLNPAKTLIFRRSTYAEMVTKVSPRTVHLQHEFLQLTDSRGESLTDEHLAASLEVIANQDMAVASLVYDDRDVDELVDEISSTNSPIVSDTYTSYFLRVAKELIDRDLSASYLDTEVLLRESLVVMAGARTIVPFDRLTQVINWFPQLTRYIVAYLESVAMQGPNDLADYLSVRLQAADQSEWVKAWLCHIPTRIPEVVNSNLLNTFRMLIENSGSSIVRAGAMGALSSAGLLDLEVRSDLLDDLSPAVKAEISFNMEVNSKQ
ncbi:RNA-directed DNA polymerase [Kribbella sp. NPDC023855]|uniref:RNA-directed DNA polymerase n=1 Tax=Kribbella sp. NPDC023855 TaxID=3154698 RepID=UPI00340F5EF4